MRSVSRLALAAAVTAACLTTDSRAFAQKPKPGGGGATPAYKIIDLRSPHHAADGNWSSTRAERISPVDPDTGLVYICGDYERGAAANPSCLWAVSSSGSIAIADLDGLIDASDVNSAGIVGGVVPGEPAYYPALWHPSFGVLELLETPNGGGDVTALNDPDENGEFQVVGIAGIQATLWNVTVNGDIVSSKLIGDATQGQIYPYDINNAGVIAGIEYVEGGATPLIAWFDETDALQVEYLPNPEPAIVYWRDLQIDDIGNVVGQGAEPIPGSVSQYPRAVVWSAMGSAVSLSSLTGGGSTYGHGIATVGGVMQVAGSAWTRNTGWYATVYSNGRFTDLTKVSKGTETWSLFEGNGVNSAGLICGRGRVGPSRSLQHHAYVLIPNVP